MGCNDKIRQRCQKVEDVCVNYNGTLPQWTSIEDDCVSIQDTTEDLYDKVTEILQGIDLTQLESCESLPQNLTVSNLFQSLIDIICTQKFQIETLGNSVETMQQQITDLQNNICD